MTITADKPNTQFYTDKFKLGRAPLPMEANSSVERFELEREVIFKHAWFIAGREDEIPEPGDYFVQEFPTADTSILVVRGRDGKVRAFHNMCRHRGNKVVHTGHLRGKAKGFSCAFHGWTYDLSGKLVIVPDEDQFFDFDKKDHGLTQVSCETWEGFIFFNVDPNPKESLHQWLGELKDRFGGVLEEGRYKGQRLFMHSTADIDCNWQIILDAFSEPLHVPFIHGKTLPEALTGTSNPLCHMVWMDVHGRNHSGGTPANPDYKPTPMEQVIYKFIDAPVFPALAADLEKLPPSINPVRDPCWAFDFHIVFPMTTFILWANGMVLIYNYWPIAVDKSRLEVKIYWNKPTNVAERLNQEITRSMGTAVIREDMSSLETTQEVYFSGAAREMHLCDQEAMVRHSYLEVEKYLRENAPGYEGIREYDGLI